MNESKNYNKRVKTYVILSILVLIITIISSSLAYFAMSTNSSKNANLSSNFGKGGGVSLLTPTPSIHLYLSNDDMSITNNNSYYATNNVSKKYETERVDYTTIKIQTLKNNDNNSYDCSLEFGIEVSGSVKDVLKSGDAFVYLSGDYTAEFDLTDNISNISVNYTLNNDNNSKEIKVALRVNNSDNNQNDLAGKDLSISTKVINFVCNGSN